MIGLFVTVPGWSQNTDCNDSCWNFYLKILEVTVNGCHVRSLYLFRYISHTHVTLATQDMGVSVSPSLTVDWRWDSLLNNIHYYHHLISGC